MLKLVGLFSLLLLGGCSVYNDRSIPSEVSIMPNDCANQQAIQNWLNYQLKQDPALFTNRNNYAQEQRMLKHKKWSLTSKCNSIE